MTKLHHRDQESAPPPVQGGGVPAASEGAIWTRLIQPEVADLSPDMARSILRIAFSESDKARMHELALKAQVNILSESEQEEIDNYARVGGLLDVMHSKARRFLKRPTDP